MDPRRAAAARRVKPLFDLKHDLHVLYKGARILGALEPETVEHQGKLTEQALDRAGKGVVLYLKCPYATLADGHQKKLQELLQELLQKDECPLLELSLAGFSAVWQAAWKGKKKPVWPSITDDSLQQSKMNDFNCSLHDLLIARRDQQLHCHKLRTLDLKGRGLHGTLPEKLATCIEMETLHLGYNSLKGMIPRAFKFMTKLKSLSLNYCELSGELPAELGELKNLERLCLDNNQLTGSIPSLFGGLSDGEKREMKELEKLAMSKENEARLEELKRLQKEAVLMDGDKQEMEELEKRKKVSKENEGRLKELKRLEKDAGLTKLTDLFLNDNHLSGAIPDTLANCRALQRVDLTNNRLTGTVPPAWPKLEARVKEQWPKLEFFKLYNNELEQNARDGDEYWKHVVDESRQEALDHARDQEYIQATNEYQSKWRTVRLEQSFALS